MVLIWLFRLENCWHIIRVFFPQVNKSIIPFSQPKGCHYRLHENETSYLIFETSLFSICQAQTFSVRADAFGAMISYFLKVTFGRINRPIKVKVALILYGEEAPSGICSKTGAQGYSTIYGQQVMHYSFWERIFSSGSTPAQWGLLILVGFI